MYISNDQLIQAGAIQLANNILNHDASVIKCNDSGLDCIATAEKTFTYMRQRLSSDDIAEWNEFILELKRREMIEKERMEARDRARSQANDE